MAAMDKVVFLVLRRMRAPLVALVIAYAIAILGLVLMPGQTEDGEVWHMDFFHAFYFVSYMATTIGFGEIPYEFSFAQRIWTVISIYLSVVTWFYAIGKIISLIQDPTFKQVVKERNFTHAVRRINSPFYIVCGYGDTGSLLVKALSRRDVRSVVIEIEPERLNELDLEDLDVFVPGLCADASTSRALIDAGLNNALCRGVVALTNDDQVNLKIAITVKLLNPSIQVICRAETHDVEANMASFGTDHIINPYDTFGQHLAQALHSPGTHLLMEWLTEVPNTPLSEPLYPPKGKWVLCGFGRFGKAVAASLEMEGVESTIIEADPEGTDCVGMCIVGRGTEAETLSTAGVEEAAGIVAGTDHDANNLSIVMTARALNEKLFMVARQNRHDNAAIFKAADLDLVMQRSEIIARKIFALLTTPLLNEFLQSCLSESNEWANEVVSRLSGFIGDTIPDTWTVTLTNSEAPAVARELSHGDGVHLSVLSTNPHRREDPLACIPLMLKRGSSEVLLPKGDYVLRRGDQILFCGPDGVEDTQKWLLQNENVLRYVMTGKEKSTGLLWQWFETRKENRS